MRENRRFIKSKSTVQLLLLHLILRRTVHFIHIAGTNERTTERARMCKKNSRRRRIDVNNGRKQAAYTTNALNWRGAGRRRMACICAMTWRGAPGCALRLSHHRPPPALVVVRGLSRRVLSARRNVCTCALYQTCVCACTAVVHVYYYIYWRM